MTDLRPDWLSHDQYPYDVRSIDLGADTLAYIDEGSGPVLLFVHAGTWSFVFRDVIARLRSDFRCITLDFPGYGLSPAPKGEPELRDLSALLGDFVDALDLQGITLVAHDLGGPVSLAAAATRRDRFTGLVLANTFAWTPDTPGLRAMFRVMSGATFTAFDEATNLVPRLASTRFGVGRHLDRQGRVAFLGPFRDRAVRRRFHSAMRSAYRDPGFTDGVAEAVRTTLRDLPVLTIFGERNDPFGFQQRHATTFADHEGIVVEKGNHFPMMDDPELFAACVRNWHARKVVGARR
jgi:haloalkane dehalogenase